MISSTEWRLAMIVASVLRQRLGVSLTGSLTGVTRSRNGIRVGVRRLADGVALAAHVPSTVGAAATAGAAP